MVQTNSSFDLNNIRHELEHDAREIQDIVHNITRRETDLRRAQQILDKAKTDFDKIDKEIKDLHNKKDQISKRD